MRVLLLGAPGSGKGTQGPRVAQHYGVPYVSSGELLRQHIRAGTRPGEAAQPYVDGGELVPDDVVLPLILDFLKRHESSDGYVLDGFPRTVGEAKAADEAAQDAGGVADAVVFLDVPKDELVRRLERRAPSSGRADDQTDVVIGRRMLEYETKTAPLRSYYEERGVLVAVDAAAPADEVTRRILAALEARRGMAAGSR